MVVMEAAESEPCETVGRWSLQSWTALVTWWLSIGSSRHSTGAFTSPRLKRKPRSTFAARPRRFEETLAAGGVGLRVLGVPQVTPLEGGILLMRDGEIIGAIGVSGMQSSQDAQVAQAGADALAQAPR